MGFIIIDAHSHLWLKQDTVVEGLPIRTLENGEEFYKLKYCSTVVYMVPRA